MTRRFWFAVLNSAGLIPLALCLGCAAATIPINYSAQNLVKLQGKVAIGTFSYRPADEKKVKPNQIQNTAMGRIFVGVDIKDFVKRATALELEKSGIVITETAPVILHGEVQEFKADDFGYSVDWSYSIKYQLEQMGTSKTLLDKVYVADRKKTGKTGAAADFSPSINEMILSAFEKFMNDHDAREILKNGA